MPTLGFLSNYQLGLAKYYSLQGGGDDTNRLFRRAQSKKPAVALDFNELAKGIAWDKCQQLLVEYLDTIDGITTAKIPKKDYEKMGLASFNFQADSVLLRDASKAKRLEHRLPMDSVERLTANLLQRSLAVMQAIKHVCNFHGRDDKTEILNQVFKSLLNQLQNMKNPKQQLRYIEADFNLSMLKIMRQAKLLYQDKDAYSDAELAKILYHYRLLGSTLTPTTAVLTVSKRRSRNELIFQASDPICQKTPEQQTAIKQQLQNHNNDPIGLANAAFAEVIASDQTLNSAQLRFCFPDGVRQAFYETLLVKKGDNEIYRKSFIRSASTAYIGNDITDDERNMAAKNNLAQLQQYAKAKGDNRPLHHMPLLADSKYRHKQNIMCKAMRHAASSKNIGFSLLPMSFFAMLGRFFGWHTPKVSNDLVDKENKRKIPHSGILNSGQRAFHGAHVLYYANPEKLLVYGCASNQNRAGTLSIAFNSLAAKCCKVFSRFTSAAKHFAATGHEIVTASITCPGSRGMKKESQKFALFTRLVDRFLYGGAVESRTKVRLPKRADQLLLQHQPQSLLFRPTTDSDNISIASADINESLCRIPYSGPSQVP